MSEGEMRWAELGEGAEFAGYRIERRLGRGGMGIVYLAVERGLDRRVALKLVAPDAAADEVFRERFAHESRIAASIEHPNVVPIYAAGEQEGIPFIAMRYVSGSDLGRKLISSGRLEPGRAVALIGQVAAGLDAIHAAGLVHRDVKPANVLLSGSDSSEHAYITDFGVARNVASTSGLTKTGRFVGTLDYVAPEQIRGGEVDARADVYALGCLLFKLLSGEVPFPRDGEAARLYAHLNDEPPAASLFTPMVPKALDRVIARAMAKSPEDRYPSAGDLGRAAAAALSGAEVEISERTVATGAAATRMSSTPTDPIAEPAGGTRAASAETPAMTAPSAPAPRRGRPGRRPIAVIGGIAAVALLAGAIALLAGGGDGKGGSQKASNPKTGEPAATTPVGSGSGQGGQQGGGGQSKPAPLKKDEFIRKGDAYCAQTQEDFLSANAEFQSGQLSDLAFAQTRFENSKRHLRKLRRLEARAPISVRRTFRKYVTRIELVHEYDRQALAAAKKGELEGIDAANAKNLGEQGDRYELARQIGFRTCSKNPG
jgi:predicted Ser/Thr protein kinase